MFFFHFLFQVAYAGYASPYCAGYANAGYPYAHVGYTGYPYAVAAPVAAATASITPRLKQGLSASFTRKALTPAYSFTCF